MPLLNDAKACYVGTTRIERIMAGSVQVWPKGPPPPFRDVELYLGNPLADPGTISENGWYLMWEAGVRPVDCDAADMYEYRFTKMENVYPDNQYTNWYRFGYRKCLCWLPRVAEFENRMVTFMDQYYVGTKPTVTVQLRYTNGTEVTTSDEIVFPIAADDLSNYEPLPATAQNYPCPESAPC